MPARDGDGQDLLSQIECADLGTEPRVHLAEGVQGVGVGGDVAEDLVFDLLGERQERGCCWCCCFGRGFHARGYYYCHACEETLEPDHYYGYCMGAGHN